MGIGMTVIALVVVFAVIGVTAVSILDERQRDSKIARFQRYLGSQMGRPDRRRTDLTFEQRVIQPIVDRLRVILKIRISDSLQQGMKMKLLNAGYPLRVSPEEYVIKSVIGALIPVVVVAGLQIFLKVEPSKAILTTMAVALLSAVVMRMGLFSKIKKRKTAIERELPELLDYCQVAVEAGLSIDSALERIVEEESGNITAYEFKIYLHDVKMGLPRAEALHQLHLRTSSDYVKSFTDGIIQSVRTGITLGNLLQIIRKDIYDDIRSRAEKRAYKAPVLMMIPMVLFIFPTIFIITLAPAVLKLIAEMGKTG